jgi:hypothetical protein
MLTSGAFRYFRPSRRSSAARARPSVIVTARKPGKRYADVPDMTPEEHRRRGDAADALFREMKRRIAAVLKDRP